MTKILIEESVLRQALEAMLDHGTSYLNHEDEWSDAVGALQVALDAAEKVEPVTFNEWWMDHDFDPVEGFPAALAAWEFSNKHATPPTNTDSELRALRDAMPHMQKINRDAQELREAARAVVEAWDKYGDMRNTDIDRLRKAL